MQGPGTQFFLQVPPWQFWLVQSPPQPQGPGGLTVWHLSLTHDPLEQSALHPHGGIESAHTGQVIDVQEYLRHHLSDNSSTSTS